MTAPRLERYLLRAVAPDGPFTAVSALVVKNDAEFFFQAAGELGDGTGDHCARATRFDLASLTKPFVATLAVVLDQGGQLSLNARVGRLLPELGSPVARAPLRDLLCHRSGLMAWLPFYELCRGSRSPLEALGQTRWFGARKGTYSDLGYILWVQAAERALDRSVGELLASHVSDALGLGSLELSPAGCSGVARCIMDTSREVELAARLGIRTEEQGPPRRGQAQDGNARFLGSLPGHAGLFGNVDHLAALGCEWLRPRRLLSRAAVDEALQQPGRFAVGWVRRSLRGSAGAALGGSAFGHTGFTGGSLWIDPAAQAVFVLLGHRKRPDLQVNALRRRFHRLAAAEPATIQPGLC